MADDPGLLILRYCSYLCFYLIRAFCMIWCSFYCWYLKRHCVVRDVSYRTIGISLFELLAIERERCVD